VVVAELGGLLKAPITPTSVIRLIGGAKSSRDAAYGHRGELVGSRCLAEVGGNDPMAFLQIFRCYLTVERLILLLPCLAGLVALGNTPVRA